MVESSNILLTENRRLASIHGSCTAVVQDPGSMHFLIQSTGRWASALKRPLHSKHFSSTFSFQLIHGQQKAKKYYYKEVFFSPKLFKNKEREVCPECAVPQYVSCHLFWRQIFWGRSEWMFSLVYLLQTSPESLVACFQVILPRNKVKDKCSNDSNSMRRKKNNLEKRKEKK